MILGSKHVGEILSVLMCKFYVSALVDIIKVTLRTTRCKNKDLLNLILKSYNIKLVVT